MFILSLLSDSLKQKSFHFKKVDLRKLINSMCMLFIMVSFGSSAQTWSHLIEGTYGGKLLKNHQGDVLVTGEARFPVESNIDANIENYHVSHPVYDFVYHLTPSADVLWAKSFSEENDEVMGLVSGHFMIENKLGEYALVLEGHHSNEQHMAFFNHHGDLLAWQALSSNEYIHYGIGTHDGGMLLLGSTEDGHGLMINMNYKGEVKWRHTMDERVTVFSHAVELTSGDFILAGQSVLEDGEKTASIVKVTDKNKGERIIWVEHLSDKGLQNSVVAGVALTQDENIIVAGETAETNTSWVAKFNLDDIEMQKDFIWTPQLGETSIKSQINDIIVTSMGRIIAVGASNKENILGNDDYWVVGLSLEGSKEWEHYYGGEDRDEAFSVVEMSSEQLVISGYSSGFSMTGTWLLSLNAKGEIDDYTPSILTR
ncbi:hypothetical protein [uncultured Shewanella sp.]|uniref:hypothetical protein n=1 Tax=uncultured Shewanella sp. TaxID=173975 RepID=UPI0026255179|nr:hypothetical protein [uncultured Shewanella sp.]